MTVTYDERDEDYNSEYPPCSDNCDLAQDGRGRWICGGVHCKDAGVYEPPDWSDY